VRDIVHVAEAVTVRVIVEVCDGVLDGIAVNVLLGVKVLEGVRVKVFVGPVVYVVVFEGMAEAVLLASGVVVREGVFDGITVDVLDEVAEGIELGTAVFEEVAVAVLVTVWVMLGVFEAVTVAVGSGVIVEVFVAVRTGVNDGVLVMVGASPSSTKVPLAFHSVPAKMRTSYVPGSHLSADCCQTAFPMPDSSSSHAFVSKYCSSPLRYQIAVHCTPGSMSV